MTFRDCDASQPKRRRRWRRFPEDARGAAAIEFALVGIPFIAIIFAILDVSVDNFIYTQIDTSTQKAVGMIRSGSVQVNELTRDGFRTQVLCPMLPNLDCAKLLVNVQPVTNFNTWPYVWTTATIDPSTQKWCPGGPADAVLVQVAYPIPLATMIWTGSATAENGTRYYLSAIGFRNDPFGVPYANPAGC